METYVIRPKNKKQEETIRGVLNAIGVKYETIEAVQDKELLQKMEEISKKGFNTQEDTLKFIESL
jgi:hypothetical protein